MAYRDAVFLLCLPWVCNAKESNAPIFCRHLWPLWSYLCSFASWEDIYLRLGFLISLTSYVWSFSPNLHENSLNPIQLQDIPKEFWQLLKWGPTTLTSYQYHEKFRKATLMSFQDGDFWLSVLWVCNANESNAPIFRRHLWRLWFYLCSFANQEDISLRVRNSALQGVKTHVKNPSPLCSHTS